MAETDDLISAEEAASIIGVAPDRVSPLVEQGLLTVHFDDDGEVRFARSEAQAVHQLGG